MHSINPEFLAAYRESVQRQVELINLLAASWDMQPNEVYYNWRSQHAQAGMIVDTAWRYFFHGLECDISNQEDGRFVRIEFGPGGRADCISSFSVLQFIMTSKAPWGYYPELQAQLAYKPAPFDELSGDYHAIHALIEPLYTAKLIELADPTLQPILEQALVFTPEGSQRYELPAPDGNPNTHGFWDMMVCHRMVLKQDKQ
ncbi:DUF6896 domain-containing protein [Herpetosiphon geysericola]|uniref:DUF6896 domain-containing protein n=1 Tax=Herpetosiphon geysericola TaxID=70996 RepID=A0A0P6Y8A3_9CHLR|nr:hypothetical protein [Herpetosiphon geysericola]KPL88126.1 hypothetical protein SE18_10415 [Herpetosiphon geysericola]